MRHARNQRDHRRILKSWPDIECPQPECDGTMKLKNLPNGLTYVCTNPKCGAMHRARKDGSPSGIPADHQTNLARRLCYAVFDRLWRGPQKQMSRDEAYEWLCGQLDLPRKHFHIGRFDRVTCFRVAWLVRGHLASVVHAAAVLTVLLAGCRAPRPVVSAQVEYRNKPTVVESSEFTASARVEWR